MAEVCDIVEDSAFAYAQTRSQIGQKVESGAAGGDSSGRPTVSTYAADSGSPLDAVDASLSTMVTDTVEASEAVQAAAMAVMRIVSAAATATAMRQTITESLEAAAASSEVCGHRIGQRILEAVRAAIEIQQRAGASIMVADQARAIDMAMNVAVEILDDVMHGLAQHRQVASIREAAADAASAGSAVGEAQTFVVRTASIAASSDHASTAATALNRVHSEAFVDTDLLSTDGMAWTADGVSMGMSFWDDLRGGSAGSMGGKVLIAGGSGLYLERAPDTGEVSASVDLGTTDMGSAQRKRLSHLYVYAEASGEMEALVNEHAEETPEQIIAPVDLLEGNALRQHRANVGRGTNARAFGIELRWNGPVQLHEILALTMDTSRRI